MTYILTKDDRDENTAKSFEKYYRYIESVRNRLPPAAYNLVMSDWYYDFRSHRCPHDSWLDSFCISEATIDEKREVEGVINLLGAYNQEKIKITYKNIISLKFNSSNLKDGHCDWRYDEFRLSSAGALEHEIEWSSSMHLATWVIECEDIVYIVDEK